MLDTQELSIFSTGPKRQALGTVYMSRADLFD